MSRCNDVTKNFPANVSLDVSIYVTLFCNDVTRYMYRDTCDKHAEPTGFDVLYELEFVISSDSILF